MIPSRPGAATSSHAQHFRERARLEAQRYGPDAWVFVRELLQNSRDAGARHVVFTVEEREGKAIVTCRDDGEGMSFEHARRYLFSLYASSKESDVRQAGKFGVGFWSILRFEPTTIAIRSRPRGGHGWGLCLEGSLEHATELPALENFGVEIRLERDSTSNGLERRVFDAVWQSARFIRCRDEPKRPLLVTVNGKSANAPFTLPAPCSAFHRGGLRGVVGLGPSPRVELFSRGLRVRAAASLDDLLSPTGRHSTRARVHFPELPGGLAPQAILESDDLEVMLSRSDAKENRALRRLIRLAEQELERLIDQQLAQAHPLPLWRRSGQWIHTRLRYSLLWRLAFGSVLGTLSALLVAWVMWKPRHVGMPAPIPGEAQPVAVAGAPPAPRAYADLGARYGGPRVDVFSPEGAEPIDLEYTPGRERLHFAALLLPDFDAHGMPRAEKLEGQLARYDGTACTKTCTSIRYTVSGTMGVTRLLIPTGHRLVADSVHVDGEPLPVFTTRHGHPVIALAAGERGTVTYRTTPAADARTGVRPPRHSPLPPDLREYAARAKRRKTASTVATLVEKTRELVAYDRTDATAQQHLAAIEAGQRFIERTLAIGAGDCDIQNGLLVALLHAADVPARLAVGYLGDDGRALPWLHAWVEFRDERGVWQIADASQPTTPNLPADLPAELAAAPSQPPAAQPTAEPAAPTEAVPATNVAAPLPAAPSTGEAVTSSRPFSAAAKQLFFNRYTGLGLLAFALAAAFGGRTRRRVHLELETDLSRLLRGMLHQPAAFSSISSLYYRPIVPTSSRGRMSLAKARELAIAGQLFRTSEHVLLARRAAENGAFVLDAQTTEGRLVADALGAIDLDRWHALMARATEDPAIAEANAVLRSVREDGLLRVSTDVPGGIAVLDLRPLRVSINGQRHRRLIVIDETLHAMRCAKQVARVAPKAAAIVLLEHLAQALQLDERHHQRVLAEASRRALLDAPR